MEIHFTNKPCAAKGLISYRYRCNYGYIMIGARDDMDALCQANRSMALGGASLDGLEIWDAASSQYRRIEAAPVAEQCSNPQGQPQALNDGTGAHRPIKTYYVKGGE